MKVKDIAALCKRRKTLILTTPDENGLQFAGDGQAMFLLEGLTDIDLETMLRFMDVTEDEAEIWNKIYEDFPPVYDRSETAPQVNAVKGKISRIEINGKDLCPLELPDRTIFIHSRYLKAVTDYTTELKVRMASNGKIYVAVSKGMFVNGIIIPFEIDDVCNNIDDATYIDEIVEFTRRAEKGTDCSDVVDHATGALIFGNNA